MSTYKTKWEAKLTSHVLRSAQYIGHKQIETIEKQVNSVLI